MAGTLLNRLAVTEGFLIPPQSVAEWLAESDAPTQKSDTTIKIALGDAKEMLETALRRKQALFLILD